MKNNNEKKSGYVYLKDKNHELEKENLRLNSEIKTLKSKIRALENKLGSVESEHERVIFERMVRSVRVLNSWDSPDEGE